MNIIIIFKNCTIKKVVGVSVHRLSMEVVDIHRERRRSATPTTNAQNVQYSIKARAVLK